ncbi:MAG: GNAT family N-acetyltransferase [Candidatus Scalinduaceae bacterium]
MKYEIVTDYQAFRKLRSEWNALLSKSQANTIFLTWEWLDAWWQSYRATEQPFIILCRNVQGELIGIAPFVLNVVKGGYFFKYKALYFWGLKIGVKEAEYLEIIAETGMEEKVCHQVVQALNERRKEWDIFFYYEVPETSICLQIIREFVVNHGWLSKETSHGCSVIKLPETFDEYIKSLKPRMRTKLRSLPRRLKESHKVEFEVCTEKDKLHESMDSFVDLHQKRWEAEDQFGTFRDSRRIKFYEMLSRYFVENNWLTIFSLKVDGVYRAHEFCFLYNNRLFVLQEGYDVEWERKGVGNVLRTFVLQYCIENNYDEYDFLGGVTYHKNSWGVIIKNSVSITIGMRNIKNMIFLYAPTVVEKLKGLYRTIVPNALVQWRIDWINARKARNIQKTLCRKRSLKQAVNN